jgi:hypothetical protein
MTNIPSNSRADKFLNEIRCVASGLTALSAHGFPLPKAYALFIQRSYP